jgi:hypothetical protein
VDEASTIEDHPNGTLDWIPVLPDVPMEGKAEMAGVDPGLLGDIAQAMERRLEAERELRSTAEAEAKADRQRYIDSMERWHNEDAKARQTPIVVNVPEQPPAQITVNVPEFPVQPAPVVNVRVPKQDAPVVTITTPEQRRQRTVLDRDRQGNVIGSHREDEDG